MMVMTVVVMVMMVMSVVVVADVLSASTVEILTLQQVIQEL